jgi:hypothetical protein
VRNSFSNITLGSVIECATKEKHYNMSNKNNSMPTSYANPAFDEEPNGIRNSAGPSPMGSNIFIVKPDDETKNRVHPQPYRNEPVTQKNIGRVVLGGIRCKN